MSGTATGPKDPKPAFCPKCNGEMGLMDAKCPHCGYDFPTTQPGAHLLPLWAWFALIPLAFVVIADPYGLLQIVAFVCYLVFSLLRAAWRRWDRYWNRW